MQFSQTSGVSSPTDLIPVGFLCWAMLTHRGMKDSQTTTSRYGDIELVVADKQPLSRRKLWTKVADPDHAGNSEAYRAMGMTALTRMLEATGLVNVNDPASYEKFNGRSANDILTMLDGKYVAIKVKIEKGEDGYQDKNEVGDYLTPNEKSSSYKNFVKLSGGDHGVTVHTNAPQPGGFSANNSQNSAPVRQGGFQQPQLTQQPQQGQSDRPLDRATASQTTTSHSNVPERNNVSSGGFNPNQAPAFLSHHNPQ